MVVTLGMPMVATLAATLCSLASAVASIGLRGGLNEYGSFRPQFVSVSGGHTVKKGGTVVLPCAIQDLSDKSVMWKRQDLLLSLRNQVVRDQSRLRLLDGFNLQITQARPSDAGVYTCAVALSDSDLEQTQTLDVQFGPFIRTIPEAGQIIVEQGQNASVECLARGNPKPRVRWRKKVQDSNRLVDLSRGELLPLTKVTRSDGGIYECVADNSIGDTAAQTISLQVLYRPITEPERDSVPTGEGFKAQLVCLVHADPIAEVTWSRERSPIDSRRVSQSNDILGSRHVLTIENVQQSDFDKYTCTARNELGSSHSQITVTGEADKVVIVSTPMDGDVDSYDLAWTVKSYSPVIEYKIAYRKTKVNSTGQVAGRWKEVLVPTTGREPVDDIHFQQQVTLRGLTPATAYDLHIQAQNKHGWNRVSDTFHFSTIGRAMESRSFTSNRSSRLALYVHIYCMLVGVVLSNII